MKILTMDIIEKKLTSMKKRCWSCSEPVSFDGYWLQSYSHDGGITIKGYDKKQWVYYECPCGYENPLSRLLTQYGNT